jgi:glutamate/tyrosine decarboxylase-like PLP-dependent enzyme
MTYVRAGVTANDQIAYAWASSPFASRLEQVAVDWLRELFELPAEFGGVLTTGATMANFVALAAARNRWAERQGVDVEEQGVAGLPAPVILSSGYLHASAVQATGMLVLGRANICRLAKDEVGRLDLAALERELSNCPATAIVIANAGEVNAGDFDPIAEIAELCERYQAWLNVDGAFGLFARLSPASRALAEGVERADSVISDGHKWLNVPYDCGVAFVRELERVPRALNVGAPYLPAADDELERLADVPLNIVRFRAHPEGFDEPELNEFNDRLGSAIRAGGRVFVGTTTYAGKTALRPAIVNWQTETGDIEPLVAVIRELIRSTPR